MGICISADSANVATAKLILIDGTLVEFSYPVKVSYVLQKDPASFICNSDEMDFDGVVSAIDDGDELQLGELYFALPLDRLNQPLHAEEMAALAVKATSALMKAGGGGGGGSRRNAIAPAVASDEGLGKVQRSVAKKGSGGCGSGRRRKFTAKLSAIPE